MKLRLKIAIYIILFILFSGCAIPHKMMNPVKGATSKSWNSKSYWYYPWGKSVTHKGIDIFAKKGTPVVSPQDGIIVQNGENERGGKVVMVLAPLLRLHYFAHLDSIQSGLGLFISKGDTIGFVGRSGNAKGKPAHLHYHIITPIPYPWRWSSEVQGWKKMFFLNPAEKIQNESIF